MLSLERKTGAVWGESRVCCPGSCPASWTSAPQLCGALLALGFTWQPARFEKLTQGLQDYALQDDQVLGLLQVSLGLRGQASYSPRGTPHEACLFLKPFSQGGESSKGKSLCPPGTDSLPEGKKAEQGGPAALPELELQDPDPLSPSPSQERRQLYPGKL